VQPALDESEITRERLALEEAIRKVEAECARKAREEPRQPPPPRAPLAPRPAPPQRPAAPPPPPAPEQYAPEPYSPPPPSPPPPPPPPRERAPLGGSQPSLSDQALKGFRDSFPDTPASSPPPAPRAEAPPPRPTPPRPEAPRPDAPRPEFRRPERPVARPAPPPPPPVQEPHPLQEYGQLEPDVQPENLWDNGPPPAVDYDSQRPPSGRPRPQQYEPEESEEPAPRRAQRAPGAYSGLIKVVAIFAVIGIIGALAVWQRNTIIGAASSVVAMVRGSGTSTTAPKPTTDPNVRPKIPDRIGQPSQSAGPAVAQRVVLYEEDPDDPQGKRSIGSAIWRTEMTQAAPGRPAELMVKADIEVPDRRMTLAWAFRRNTDQSLPASHTIEIVFNMPADSPSGGVQNVPGVLMKQAEQTRGVPLSGLAVKVTPGFFLIGLSAVEADMQRNLQLLKERSWFDIPIVYNNNRRAILAVEKGTPGERAFAEAFAAWKQ
jgi:hypothetical protein